MTGPVDDSEPASPDGDGGLVRLRLDLGYDGSGFAGWARQPGLRTVQGVVEEGLAQVLRLPEAPTVACAGRTDAGVHASGQVAHVDVPAASWANVAPAPLRRLRGVLPPDVRVHEVRVAPAGFDARFSALARRYAYRVCDGAAGPDPLARHRVLWHRRSLDASRLNEAARPLLGEHDFAAYCRRRQGASTVRRLIVLTWDREPDGLLVATVEADAFCHTMVRALVGAMLAVGDGRRPVTWPAEVLAAGVRDSAVTVAPAHGLTFAQVRYPPDEQLAARAEATRRNRV